MTPSRELLHVVKLMSQTLDLEALLSAIQGAGGELLGGSLEIALYDPVRDEFAGGHSARSGPWGEAALSQKVVRQAPDGLAVALTTPDGELMGLLSVTGTEYTEERAELAAALGSLAAIAVKRQLLVNEAKAKQEFEREMTTARDIVAGLVPREPLRVAGFELDGWMRPARLTGGDIYDYQSLGEGQALFLVADASGHGLDSTLIAVKCRALVRALLDGRPLEEAAARINRLFYGDSVYATACFGTVDTASGQVDYVSAGQQPILCYRAHEEALVELPVTGPPLGADPDAHAEVASLRLGSGDVFLVTSDGFPEWRGPSGDFYGEERVAQVLRYCHSMSAGELGQRLCEDATRFARGLAASDDLTVLSLRRLASSGG